MNGTWTTLDLAGKPADVYDPAGDAPRFGVLFLHDLDGRTPRDQPDFSRLLDELGLACVAPHGGPCWWAPRVCPGFDPTLTPEHFLLERALPVFADRWKMESRAIGLYGVGMGGQGALRLAFRHPKRFAVVAARRAALDFHDLYYSGTLLDEMYDSKEQCRQDTAILHVHPAEYPPHIAFACPPDDEWFRGNDRLHEKLAALGIPHEFDATSPGSDEAALRFLHRGLVQMSRRLL